MKEAPPQPAVKAKRKAKPVLEHVPENGHAGNSRFARALASNDYGTREKGLQALTRFLIRKHDISEPDMLKIWKGLFYAFWHSDLAPVQIALAERLAGILPQMPDEAGYLYFTVFLTTMRREWFGIDRLRLDKFLMLIRRFVAQLFELLRSRRWEAELLSQYASFLRERVLMPTDTYKAIGLAYHVADVFLPELQKVVEAAHAKGVQGAAPPAEALAELLQPFVLTLAVAGEAAHIRRLQEAVFHPLIEELQDDGSSTDDRGSSTSYTAHLDVVQLATALFDLGAAPATRARNREALYDLSKELEKTTRKRQKLAHSQKQGKQQQQQQDSQTSGLAGPAPVMARPADGIQDQFTFSSGLQEAIAAPLSTPLASQPQHPAASGKKRKARLSAAGAAEAQAAPSRSIVLPAAGAAAPTAAAPEFADTPAAGKKKKRKSASVSAIPQAVPAAATAAAVDDFTHEAAADDSPVFGLCTSAQATTSEKAGKPAHGQVPSSSKPNASQQAALRALVHEESGQDITWSQFMLQNGGGGSATASLKKKKKKSSEQEVALPQTSGKRRSQGKPVDAQHDADDGSVTPPTGKKGVTIDLSQNLYFAFGGPKAPPEVRTPPTARSKGGILKAKSAVSAQPPASAPPKLRASSGSPAVASKATKKAERRKSDGRQHAQQDQLPSRGKVTPSSVPRARAGLFF